VLDTREVKQFEERSRAVRNQRNAQDSLQPFLVYRHLNGYVWEIAIDLFIRAWRTSGVIL
jgi:hypothetical protein